MLLFSRIAFADNIDDLPDDIGAFDSEYNTTHGMKINDKFEKSNREIFYFNRKFDKVITNPAIEVYRKITFSAWGRKRVKNFFSNINEPRRMVNSVFSGSPSTFFIGGFRFLMNSVFGLGGVFDVAAKMGVKKHNITFTDVMSKRLEMKNGPYIILPLFGPSTVRNSTGLIIDTFASDPFDWLLPLNINIIKASIEFLLAKEKYQNTMQNIENVSIDEYATLRSLYYQSDVAQEFRVKND